MISSRGRVVLSTEPVRVSFRRLEFSPGLTQDLGALLDRFEVRSKIVGHGSDADLVSRLVGVDALPPELLPQELNSSVTLSFGGDDRNKNREIWSGLGGQLKASFTLHVDVAADTFDWMQEAPAVERIEALAAPVPSEPDPETGSSRAIDRSPFRR